MKATAQLNNLRMSPQKVRLVADRVRGLGVEKALGSLDFELKHAGAVVAKLVRSAVANAEKNHDMKAADLIISDIQVNAGPTMKRWRARAYGRAAKIMKRTSKVTVVVSDGKEKVDVVKAPATKKAAKKATKKATKKASK